MNTFCLLSLVDHMSEEERNKEPSLFTGAVSKQLTSVDKETLKEAVKPGNNLCSMNLSVCLLWHFKD